MCEEVIHAAGNDGANLDSVANYPSPIISDGSSSPYLITVGASGWQGVNELAASFSNYGASTVDLFAPGVDIYSTEVLSADTGFAVDTNKFGLLCTKNVFDAKVSSDGKNALVNNVAYLRLSTRVNMAVLNSNANMKFDFSNVKAALETP